MVLLHNKSISLHRQGYDSLSLGLHEDVPKRSQLVHRGSCREHFNLRFLHPSHEGKSEVSVSFEVSAALVLPLDEDSIALSPAVWFTLSDQRDACRPVREPTLLRTNRKLSD